MREHYADLFRTAAEDRLSKLRRALADCFAEAYGWPIGEANVAIVNGSQIAAFYLLNMFSGHFADGSRRKILLPVVPEYIGYADQGIES